MEEFNEIDFYTSHLFAFKDDSVISPIYHLVKILKILISNSTFETKLFS
jgi:hypothetical protein